MTKDQWRAIGKEKRRTLSPEERSYQTTALTRAILKDPRWQRANTTLLFLSFGSEWDTSALIQEAWHSGKTVVLTRCLADHQMQVCRYPPDTTLITTLGSLKEIAPEAVEPISMDAIDFCLVPGLLFDPYGTRLGYGAGYYDRFLPKLPASCTILAAGFNNQLVGEKLPCETTDFRLPEIWTPDTQIMTRPPFNK